MELRFEYYERAAVPALRPYLGALAGYAYLTPPPPLHRGLPSRALTIVLSLDEPVGVTQPAPPDQPAAPVDKYDSLVGGLHSTAVWISDSPNASGIQLALTPTGCRALLGLPPGELGSRVLHLDDILGRSAHRLSDELRAQPTWEQRFRVVEEALLRTAAARSAGISDEPRPELGWAWHRLCESGGALSIQELSRDVGWSRRYLTERFHAEYGLPPKVMARILRFERGVARLRRVPRTRLADLAADLGYADQAHLSREWQSIAGCSPSQWLAEEFPIVQDRRAEQTADSSV